MSPRTPCLCAALLAVIAGCSSQPGSPSDILNDGRLQALLKEAAARAASEADPLVASDLVGCTDLWTESKFFAGYDYSVEHPDDPKYAAADMGGTWNFMNCTIVASSDGSRDGIACGGSITYTDNHDGHLDQANMSAVSSGDGGVSFLAGTGQDDALIIQTNHAVGAECDQHVVNLIVVGASQVRVDGKPSRVSNMFTAILDSTCPAPTWQCANSLWER